MNELLELTATEAINHIHSGSITAERYASELLGRYRESRGLNAVTWIDEGRVLESARAVDLARSKGRSLGPLAGLPLVLKDNINTVGFPTTAGTAMLKGNYPKTNAPVAETLFRNGAILLGKANMDELGRGFTSSNPTFGFSKNPYDLRRVPGGGAGGTGAAIAARITPAGLGSDTAGSARIPASFCGIAGFRPSTGGLMRPAWNLGSWTVTTFAEGVVPITYSITTPAPMGRTVSDVALLNAAVTEGMASRALPLRGARFGVPRGYYWEDVDPEVLRVSERALDRLRAEGAVLVEVDARQWAQAAHTLFPTLGLMHALKDLADFLATHSPGTSVEQVVSGLLSRDISARVQREVNNPIPVEKAEEGRRLRVKLAMQYEELLRTNDVCAILYPTVPFLPPEIRLQGDGPDDTVDLNGKQVNYFGTVARSTHISSVVGTPSLSVPAGFSSSGLPVGISLDGPAGCDRALLGLGLSVEAALGRLPPPPSGPC
jgi:Asp-tRNA(Asn)/Glu-tRNA(Gln) amidotransferase A subunit family amidase